VNNVVANDLGRVGRGLGSSLCRSRLPQGFGMQKSRKIYGQCDNNLLTFQAYIKFCGAPIQVRHVRTPFFSPNGKLPVFRHGSVVLTKFEDIVQHLSKKVKKLEKFDAKIITLFIYLQNFYADIHLSEVQKYEASSYACYLEEKLLPALLHMW
jgi:hypothetical protein